MSTPATNPLHVLARFTASFLPDCNLAVRCEVFPELFNCCSGHLYQSPPLCFIPSNFAMPFYTHWQASGVQFRKRKGKKKTWTNMHHSKQGGGVPARGGV